MMMKLMKIPCTRTNRVEDDRELWLQVLVFCFVGLLVFVLIFVLVFIDIQLQVLVFCFVDLLATDFLLAAIVTYAVSKGLSVVRF